MTGDPTRRRFLAAGATVGVGGLAGCADWLLASGSRSPPLVEDRPDAVYVPTHVEGMQPVGSTDAGPYRVTLAYSFPHRFWLVTGDRTERVTVEESDTVHLMAVVRDRETGTVVPNDGVRIEVLRDGETVAARTMWPMLSQNMGVHAGDNVSFPGEGAYTVRVTVGPAGIRTTGAFDGRFEEGVTADIPFEFSRADLEGLSFERLPDRQGERGAVEPMAMARRARLPPAGEFPGTVGTAESGDARLVVAATDPPAGVDGERYLAVSARTPYNRYPLPLMALFGRLGDAFEGALAPALDPELGYHYGAAVDRAAGELRLVVDAPPQIARHEGYETAFVGMPAVTVSV
ncbi:MAG: iron transporter [Halobacteriaceae archaeon]